MAIHIHSNRTGTAIVQLDGLAKDPVWGSSDGDLIHVIGQEAGPADRFTALIVPQTGLGICNVVFSCNKLDDSAQLNHQAEIQIVEGPASAITSMTVVEN